MAKHAERSESRAGRWVLLVVGVGLLVGTALAFVIHVPVGPAPGPGGPPGPSQSVVQAALVVSTVNIALLAALLVVYARSYRSTRASFLLGLWVFLFALLLANLLVSPLLIVAFDAGPGGFGRLLTLGQLLTAVALSIFLYLSLE
jgi:hypothetical protein